MPTTVARTSLRFLKGRKQSSKTRSIASSYRITKLKQVEANDAEDIINVQKIRAAEVRLWQRREVSKINERGGTGSNGMTLKEMDKSLVTHQQFHLIDSLFTLPRRK
jgi:hypothetical protein